jgi:hypothetical protein
MYVGMSLGVIGQLDTCMWKGIEEAVIMSIVHEYSK